jgi:hypothetical protein
MAPRAAVLMVRNGPNITTKGQVTTKKSRLNIRKLMTASKAFLVDVLFLAGLLSLEPLSAVLLKFSDI